MDERSLRHVVLTLLGLLGLGAAALASRGVTSPTGFFVVTGVAITGMYAIAGLLLAWYAVRRGSTRHLILAITFAVAAGACGLQATSPHGASATWMWAIGHIVLPAGVALALLGGPKQLRDAFSPPKNRVRGTAIAGGYIAALLAIAYLAPQRGDVPVLSDPTKLVSLCLLVVAISATTIVLGLRRGRREDLESWLTVVAAGTLVDAALTMGAGHPGTLGQMMARIIGLMVSLALLRAVILDSGKLWKKLGFAGRFAPLDASSAILDEREVIDQARSLMPRTAAAPSLSVVLFAIDAIDDIHDLGHLTSERVISEVGRRLRMTLRDADVIGHHGDEAFIVLLPETDVDGARIAVERSLEAIRNRPISGVHGNVTTTASAGVAEAHGIDLLERVLGAAAAALDSAHNAGGDRLVILAAPVDSHAPPPSVAPAPEPDASVADPSLAAAA